MGMCRESSTEAEEKDLGRRIRPSSALSLGTPIPASSGGFAGRAQGGQRGTRGAVGVEELFMLSRWHCEPWIVGIQSSLFPFVAQNLK